MMSSRVILTEKFSAEQVINAPYADVIVKNIEIIMESYNIVLE